MLKNWSVGVTVSERSARTLERTLASIAAAGFPQPRIFADGDLDLEPEQHASYRIPSVGGWPNFWLGLTELLARDPNCDAYLMIQDDVVFSRGVFQFLQQFEVPDDCGVISLFCPACNNADFGWNAMPAGYGMAGAQALAFSRERAFEFLAHPWTVNHRRHAPKSEHFRGDGLHHIDGAVGQWCELTGLKAYTHSPSLSQHIGHQSVMYPGFDGKRDRRFADTFPGEAIHIRDALSRYSDRLDLWMRDGGSPEWSIPAALWTAIANDLVPNMRTLETGSGLSTMLFEDAHCRHTALEHDTAWSQRLVAAAPHCKASLEVHTLAGNPPWYDWKPPGEAFDLIFIDGPPGLVGRSGILRILEKLIHDDTVIYLDDTNREAERALADSIAETLSWSSQQSQGARNGYTRISRQPRLNSFCTSHPQGQSE